MARLWLPDGAALDEDAADVVDEDELAGAAAELELELELDPQAARARTATGTVINASALRNEDSLSFGLKRDGLESTSSLAHQ
jgi:hypothetical protein